MTSWITCLDARLAERRAGCPGMMVGAVLADGSVFHALPKAIQGIAGWTMYVTAFLTAFPDDLQVTVDDSFATADKVAARWIARGTHNGPLRGIAPTGKEVRWLGIALYYLSDGKIKEVWRLNDALGMMQQIGTIPSN